MQFLDWALFDSDITLDLKEVSVRFYNLFQITCKLSLCHGDFESETVQTFLFVCFAGEYKHCNFV